MIRIISQLWAASADFVGATHRNGAKNFGRGRKRHFSATARVLVLEHRDEVFARLAADLDHFSSVITRAMSSADASHKIEGTPFDLVLANASPPDESAWLMVSRWRSHRSQIPVWLYSPWQSELDRHWQEFTRIDGLVFYAGNVWRLSNELERIVDSSRIAKHAIHAAA